MEIVLDGERFEEFHGGLTSHFGNSVKEQCVFSCLCGVVVVHGIQLKNTIILELTLKIKKFLKGKKSTDVSKI